MRSIVASRWARPHAHSVVPAVNTVPPGRCTPITACPCSKRATSSGSSRPSTRQAMNSHSERAPSGTPRRRVVAAKQAEPAPSADLEVPRSAVARRSGRAARHAS